MNQILVDDLIFPFCHLSHMIQIHLANDVPLEQRVKDYTSAVFAEGLKLAAYGMLIHNCYELYRRFLS